MSIAKAPPDGYLKVRLALVFPRDRPPTPFDPASIASSTLQPA
jgi:hypothetical protein